ncbi:hypothetical protein BDZ89DRAFT_1145445 [Hymenopellis radicata]|nr:hypothetical protein BDZ89DRAFT_1145445 [Hymenopellis radicata]
MDASPPPIYKGFILYQSTVNFRPPLFPFDTFARHRKMDLKKIVDRYEKLDQLQIALGTPPADPSMPPIFVQIDSHGFSYKWRDLNERLEETHMCPGRSPYSFGRPNGCQGADCSGALNEFGKWNSFNFMDAVNHIWDDDLKKLCIGIFSRFNSMAVHHRLDTDVERFYHALPTFMYE